MKFLSIGSDPELFLVDVNDEIISAVRKVGGTKKKPKALRKPGFFVQEDNVLVEYNIPPQETKSGFVDAIQDGMELIKEIIPENHSLKIKASHRLHPRHLKSAQARTFGCDPDICAWDRTTSVSDNAPTTLRTTGGHVYIGYEGVTEDLNFKIAKACDIVLGVPSMLLDLDHERRELYGKAGSFRHKPFGLEYRTLSSFWIANKELIEWVYDGTQAALRLVEYGIIDTITREEAEYVQLAINCNNRGCIDYIMGRFDVKMP